VSPVAIIVIGLLPAQLAGAWAYRKAHRSASAQIRQEWVSATVSGLVTTVVASVIYLAFGLHKQLAGGSSWGASVFMGACFGICQGVLGRGEGRPPKDPDDFWPPTLEEGDKSLNGPSDR
jgi:hypothetical protein